ncbi:MAG: EF-hand domain-containing protein [Candidatus Didemnitutus sp.]|nr:EF-hand domain-containing protein [Candidatus Didemnitutus sp.]
MGGLPHKIIITGTGRAGTTFLVRLLTELGLDTGFTRENWREHVHAHCSAGMEKDLTAPDAPRVVKDPDLCERLPAILAEGRIVVEHALVPVRDLASASASRVRIGADAPGGIVGTGDARQQPAVLAERFHHLVETLVLHDIPHTFLAFPRFACDAGYCYERLRFLLPGVSAEEFAVVFARVSDPKLIHDFRQSTPSGEVGRPSRAYRWGARLRKWPRRLAVAAALVAVGVAVGARRARPLPLPPVLPTPAALAATENARTDFFAQLHRAFLAADDNADGYISADELAWLAAIDPAFEQELQVIEHGVPMKWDRVYASFDLNRDGRVSEPEFVAMVAGADRRSATGSAGE